MYRFDLETSNISPKDVSYRVGPQSSDGARYMMRWRAFAALPEASTATLIQVSVGELCGDYQPKGLVLKSVYEQARARHWGICLPVIAPLCLLNENLLGIEHGGRTILAMDPIGEIAGYPLLFSLTRGTDGVSLNSNWTGPDVVYDPGTQFIFQERASVA